MGSKRAVLAAAVAVALVAGAVQQVARAADEGGQYKVRAFGKVETCYALNRAVNSAKKEDDWGALYGFSLYTMGYLTGINRLASDTYDIGGRKNSKTLMVWLEKYCLDNPEHSFDAALYQLTAEIFPARTTRAPAESP
ncbi:MAG: hypothetical protein KDI17_14415 [Halioglobus sp.]|nr:hypothetical protein [Halioglobus sp.]